MFRDILKKISRIFYWLIILISTAYLLGLMIVNSHLTSLDLNPFSWGEESTGLTAPLFIWLGLFFVLGLGSGGLFVWIRQRKYRKKAWKAVAEEEEYHYNDLNNQ